ncbi:MULTISPECIES: hypothetical protein [unclassified Cupriavidus]|uniref:hypothetical protein n=1 Tax=unclassified Cupriavidus TaxID=2640874 RepID=UPI00295E4B3C|nr:hypothetical protein [Cupriavidus sp. TA19]
MAEFDGHHFLQLSGVPIGILAALLPTQVIMHSVRVLTVAAAALFTGCAVAPYEDDYYHRGYSRPLYGGGYSGWDSGHYHGGNRKWDGSWDRGRDWDEKRSRSRDWNNGDSRSWTRGRDQGESRGEKQGWHHRDELTENRGRERRSERGEHRSNGRSNHRADEGSRHHDWDGGHGRGKDRNRD